MSSPRRIVFLISLIASAFSACRRPAEPRSLLDIAQPMESPGWLVFKQTARVNPRTLFKDHAQLFQLSPGTEMRIVSEETDEIGVRHFVYQQFYKTVEVENATFRVRAKGDNAVSANGELEFKFEPAVTRPAITEEQAVAILRQKFGGTRFYREDDFVKDLERVTGERPYSPKGTLLYTEVPESGERVLAWMFRTYVLPVESSRKVYIDATSGAVVKELTLFPSCFTGSGNTSFRGNQTFNTARSDTNFVLTDDCSGNRLRFLRPATVTGSREVSDTDNNWTGNDIAAVTSFWSLGIAYDYFALNHGRQSYDGKNADMTIVNDPAEEAARGGNGIITCRTGATSSPTVDFNTVDIVGHEFTHSLIEKSAALGNERTKESAALNESFSDIFGQVIERWDEQNANPEWIIGDDKGCNGTTCRNLLNPKAFNQPDTYKGNFWMTKGIDPHTNGTVQNRWFALLTDGGAGTNNELGAPYDIKGLGIVKTRRIAYRTLTRYLTADSNYEDARNGSIQATRDLFGAGSAEENQVTKAWCSVGLCPFTMPKQADVFDRPGGNPNPASPNNNNTVAGATPLGSAAIDVTGRRSHGWSREKYPRLRVAGLNIYPVNDVDYFRIEFPQIEGLGGRCFHPGFAFHFGREVNARILINGVVKKTYKQVTDFSLAIGDTNAEDFVLEVTPPFPGQLVDYSLTITSFLRIDSLCFQTAALPRKFKLVRDCIACDLDVLSGVKQVILDPDYRKPEGIAPSEHFVFWNGEGELDIPIAIIEGNSLSAELVDEAGKTVTSVSRNAVTNELALKAGQRPAGVYSLRFSGYGSGTKIQVKAPAAP